VEKILRDRLHLVSKRDLPPTDLRVFHPKVASMGASLWVVLCSEVCSGSQVHVARRLGRA
jgi:hypothetical protein